MVLAPQRQPARPDHAGLSRDPGPAGAADPQVVILQARARQRRRQRRIAAIAVPLIAVAAWGIASGSGPGAGPRARPGHPPARRAPASRGPEAGSGGTREFNIPNFIAVTRSRVLVLNAGGYGSITELKASNRRWISTVPERYSGGTQIGDFAAVVYKDHPWQLTAEDSIFSLTEINPRNGHLGTRLHVACQFCFALAGSHLWAAQSDARPGNPAERLTELNASTGHTVRTLRWPPMLSPNRFDLGAMTVRGSRIWMTVGGHDGHGSGGVAEMNARGGHVRIFTGAWASTIGSQSLIVVDGGHVWVISEPTFLELNVRTGQVVRDLPNGTGYGLNSPLYMAADGVNLWVASAEGGYHDQGMVTELNAGTGRVIRIFSSRKCGLHGPSVIAFSGTHAWILNSNSITELPAR